MHSEQRARTRAEFEDRGFSTAVIANPAVITWLTGIALNAIPGGSPFSAPPLVWFEDGEFILIAGDILTDRAKQYAKESGCNAILYESYTTGKPLTPHRNLAEEFSKLSAKARGEVAVEIRDLPAYLLKFFAGEVTAIDGWSAPLRKVKTAEEIEKMRESFRLADIGQTAARAATNAGASEMDVYLAVYSAIVAEAAESVFVGNDFVSCRRENNIGGQASNRRLEEGDSIIVDISAVKEGYWSDSCATYFVSRPTPGQAKAYEVVSRALQAGTEMLRPGTRACEVDRAMRALVRDAGFAEYPHHGGHGLGVTAHEAPRIVDYNEEVLEEGMVVMLEPGTYIARELAVRLEHGVLVTADGPQMLGNSAI